MSPPDLRRPADAPSAWPPSAVGAGRSGPSSLLRREKFEAAIAEDLTQLRDRSSVTGGRSAGSIRRLAAPVAALPGNSGWDFGHGACRGESPSEISTSGATSDAELSALAFEGVGGAGARALLEAASAEAAETAAARISGVEFKSFALKVEQEHAKLKAQLQSGSDNWRKAADHLSSQISQLKSQLAQTSEAAMWAGKELGGLREELQQLKEQRLGPSAAAAEESHAERVKQARNELRAAAEAIEGRYSQLDVRVAEMRQHLEKNLCDFQERLEGCRGGLAKTNDFFSQAVAAVSKDIASLSQGLGAVEVAVSSLELHCAREGVGLPSLGIPPAALPPVSKAPQAAAVAEAARARRGGDAEACEAAAVVSQGSSRPWSKHYAPVFGAHSCTASSSETAVASSQAQGAGGVGHSAAAVAAAAAAAAADAGSSLPARLTPRRGSEAFASLRPK
eukprot:TRINITY_DN8135_c0_g1_i2.p1 TRINITY_DN8135_c0_g1~~TRINITY_DN8135_c0_g1_i2.p1  ORF type:complete len:451 (-),score=118.89 TRINITY_DN8135_c0_g1_i2:175-1527(-)